MTRARHRENVAAAVEALSRALGQSESELMGEDLRLRSEPSGV